MEPVRRRARGPVRLTLLLAWLVPSALSASAAAVPEAAWGELAAGLDLARFVPDGSAAADSALTILRVDPARWELRLLCADETPARAPATACEWAARDGLVAAINAGMFAADGRTHVGYLRCGEPAHNATGNRYQSVAAFSPRVAGQPVFRIFDLDRTPLETLTARYDCLVQNLRLIKRPRENRWARQERRWSEAALGEDDQGRALLIFCRTPYTMHDFNRLLLTLPVGLVAAQHLEGGPQAQLYIHAGAQEMELFGGFETGLMPDGANACAWPIPNILGIAPRDPPGED